VLGRLFGGLFLCLKIDKTEYVTISVHKNIDLGIVIFYVACPSRSEVRRAFKIALGLILA
tara:strand:- start:210 stop:389 length:180 start_codon:yes stop_codon:yes gene_type:complete